jgi:hypothetical protein
MIRYKAGDTVVVRGWHAGLDKGFQRNSHWAKVKGLSAVVQNVVVGSEGDVYYYFEGHGYCHEAWLYHGSLRQLLTRYRT